MSKFTKEIIQRIREDGGFKLRGDPKDFYEYIKQKINSTFSNKNKTIGAWVEVITKIEVDESGNFYNVWERVWKEDAFLAKWDKELKKYVPVISSKYLDPIEIYPPEVLDLYREDEKNKIKEFKNRQPIQRPEELPKKYKTEYESIDGYIISKTIVTKADEILEEKRLREQKRRNKARFIKEVYKRITLTDKQKEFLSLLFNGNNLTRISEILNISPPASSKHFSLILNKLEKFNKSSEKKFSIKMVKNEYFFDYI